MLILRAFCWFISQRRQNHTALVHILIVPHDNKNNNNDNKVYLYCKVKCVLTVLYCNICFVGGIRCGELGGVMHGRDDKNVGNDNDGKREILRLAIPRRTYTESHMKYVPRKLALRT